MIMKWQVSAFMPFMNGDLSFCDVHSQAEYILSVKPKYYWSHYVQKFNLGFSISLCLSEHLNVFTACLSAEWFFYYKRQSVMCEIVVAMAMSNLGFLFIHSLLVTHKRDFDSVSFCFILLFLMNQHKKGEKWKHASICQGACVRVRIIVQKLDHAQMCMREISCVAVPPKHKWFHLPSGCFYRGIWVWLCDRLNGARTTASGHGGQLHVKICHFEHFSFYGVIAFPQVSQVRFILPSSLLFTVLDSLVSRFYRQSVDLPQMVTNGILISNKGN